MKQDFTTVGARHFLQDLAAIQSVINSCVKYAGGPLLGMPRLREGVEFLNLPLEPEDGGLSLKEATDLMFTSNAGATEVLERLKMNHLSNAHARAILQKRVEAST